MKRLKREDWPDWIKEKLKGIRSIEVREHNGKYYLYKCYSVWDPKKKRAVKKMKYLQRLSKDYKGVKDIGHVLYLHYLLEKSNILSKIKEFFPIHWKDIISFSMNRITNPLPVTQIKSWTEKVGVYEVLKEKRGNLRKTLLHLGSQLSPFESFIFSNT